MARDIFVDLGDTKLASGDVLTGDIVQGRLYGEPGKPLILIPGGISASRFVADLPEGPSGVGDGWWTTLIGPGKSIDLTKFQVLGIDLAPSGNNAKTRVTITTHDQARRIAALLDHLDIQTVDGMIGTSYGGMVLLAFAEIFPARAKRLCLLGATHRAYPMGVAWRGIQRRIIDFAEKCGQGEEGLKLARELAMTTYRSAEEFTERFSAAQTGSTPIKFDVGDYLQACGARYPDIMPVQRFLALSESIDLHSVDPAQVTMDVMIIATDSDRLAPPSENQILHQSLKGKSELTVISSLFGHDSFLKEFDALGPILKRFCDGDIHAN